MERSPYASYKAKYTKQAEDIRESVRVRGKKELDITFTHEDEYKKALQLLALAAQQKDYEQRKVG